MVATVVGRVNIVSIHLVSRELQMIPSQKYEKVFLKINMHRTKLADLLINFPSEEAKCCTNTNFCLRQMEHAPDALLQPP